MESLPEGEKMRTLDEVIEAFSGCEKYPDCPLYGYCGHMCMNIQDALHHLKEYKRVQNKIEKIALGSIEDTLDKLDNKPLTWDELKKMKGKPVWIEDHNDDDEPYNRWYIVERFIKEQDDEYALLNDLYFSRKYFNDKTDGWQAYRKERE